MPALLKKVLSILGLIAFFGFIFASFFFGFMRLEIECKRQPGAVVICNVRETRLFGLYKREVVEENVTAVGYSTAQDINPGIRVTLASTVVLVTPKGDIPVSLVVSNVGSWRKEVITRVRDYLESGEVERMIRVNEINLFGWIGAALVAFIVLSYISYFFGKKKKGKA